MTTKREKNNKRNATILLGARCANETNQTEKENRDDDDNKQKKKMYTEKI